MLPISGENSHLHALFPKPAFCPPELQLHQETYLLGTSAVFAEQAQQTRHSLENEGPPTRLQGPYALVLRYSFQTLVYFVAYTNEQQWLFFAKRMFQNRARRTKRKYSSRFKFLHDNPFHLMIVQIDMFTAGIEHQFDNIINVPFHFICWKVI